MNIKFLVLLLFSWSVWADSPEWIHDTGRRVVGGDIIHWGTGDASSSDIAIFKARQMATKTLIEECGGVANKEIVPRKQYVEINGSGYQAYALVSLDFSSCEAAKKSDGKRLENPELVENQKIYNKLLFGNLDEKNSEQLDAIRNSIKQLKEDMDSLPAQAPVIQVQRVIQPAKLPATSSMKIYCQARYNAMMNTLLMKAANYGGNVAAPELNNELGAAYQQRALCAKME